MRNARFWVWHCGGWVKLTLAPGGSLSTFAGGPADEGFQARATTYAFDGAAVSLVWAEWGRDCDGRYESGGELLCALADVRVSATDAADVMAPAWERAESYQRDHSAEAAGY